MIGERAKELEQCVLAAVNGQRLTERLRAMVSQQSYTHSEGEVALGRWLVDHLRACGIEANNQAFGGGRLNTIARLRGRGPGPSLMLNGHIDTNMAGFGWTRDPLGAALEDGYLFGIGVSNMKSADAAMIEAAVAIRDAGVTLAGDLIVALVVGELQGGVGTVHMLSQGVRADHFIVGEPTDLALLTLHAGAVEIRVDVYGETRHLSKMESGVNAIEKACEVVGALKGFSFSGAGNAEYRGLQRINVGSIRGGMGSEYLDWRTPSVPDMCTLKVACRIAPGQTPEGILDDIRHMLAQLQTHDPALRAGAELQSNDQRLYMPPFEVSRNDPFVRLLAQTHREMTGSNPRAGGVAPYKFYGTDAAHLANVGMTGVVYGPGGAFNTMPDERVLLDDVVTAAKVYALTALRTCGVAEEIGGVS